MNVQTFQSNFEMDCLSLCLVGVCEPQGLISSISITQENNASYIQDLDLLDILFSDYSSITPFLSTLVLIILEHQVEDHLTPV